MMKVRKLRNKPSKLCQLIKILFLKVKQKMKKFEKVAMVEGNEKFENAVSRIEKLYDPIYGDAPMRSEFDRDYTRIINCNAYRRLKHKTQVFFSPKNDHICTRIEHVNLVESISNTIANYLGLNAELTKAII